MKRKKLQRVFEAVRSYEGHTLAQSAERLEVSSQMLRLFFMGDATSAPLEERMKGYIEGSDLVKTIRELGLDPYQQKKEIQ